MLLRGHKWPTNDCWSTATKSITSHVLGGWWIAARRRTKWMQLITCIYMKIWCICLLLQYILMAYYTLNVKIKTNISFMITMIKWQVNTNSVREFSNIKTPLPRTWHTCYHNNSKRPYFVNKLFVVFHVLLFIHIVSILSVWSTHFTPISHNTPEGSGRPKNEAHVNCWRRFLHISCLTEIISNISNSIITLKLISSSSAGCVKNTNK